MKLIISSVSWLQGIIPTTTTRIGVRAAIVQQQAWEALVLLFFKVLSRI